MPQVISNSSKTSLSRACVTIYESSGAVLRLSFSLAKVNFKLRNEGSYLGLLWYILNPLALFLIILFIKQEAFSAKDIPYYPVYLLIGILMFNLCTQIIASSITVISSNGGFIKSIKIPIESLVVSKVLQFLFSHIFEIILLAVSMVWMGLSVSSIIFYLPLLALFVLFVAGISFLFATLGAHISDLNNVWTVISQLLFFVTPIFYMPTVGSLLFQVNQYNPLYYFMKLSRQALIQKQFESGEFLYVGIFSIFVFCIGLFIFEKYKSKFAELV